MRDAIRSYKILILMFLFISARAFSAGTFDDALSAYNNAKQLEAGPQTFQQAPAQFQQAHQAFQDFLAANPAAPQAEDAAYYSAYALFHGKDYAGYRGELDAFRAKYP